MSEQINDLVMGYILHHYVMVVICLGIIWWSLTVGYRTGVYEIMVVGGGVVPLLIYYIYRSQNLWPPGLSHGAYHRIGMFWLFGSMFITLYLVYKRVYNDR